MRGTLTKPFLTWCSDADAIIRDADRRFRDVIPGAQGQAHTTIISGEHFLQEDESPQLAAVLNGFLEGI